MTSRTLSRPTQYRHVTFAEDIEPTGQALNLSPVDRVTSRVPARSGLVDDLQLTAEEEVFVNWLMRLNGLSPSDYKPGTMARRMHACLRALRVGSVAQARRAIERTPELSGVATNALVIGVTSFFRDPSVFDHLQRTVLPSLLDDLRPHGPPLRVWSVGCSDGPELYSVGMVLGELNALFRSTLLGTDCRETSIRHARKGVYSASEIRSLPHALRQKYFVPDGPSWRVLDVLKQNIHFRVGNVLQQCEVGPFDLIFCRNMAIYLEPDAAGRLWMKLQDSLRPGGFLVLGKAETPLGAGKLAQVSSGIYRRSRG